jgi:tRNA(Arg) A34 adenosine deaminase TadA
MMPCCVPSFDDQVRNQIERLQDHSLRTIERQTIEKRMAWWEARGNTPRDSTPSPRLAFETLFFEYMGLVPADLPIVRESEDEIVWESRNPCPTLEACRSLNLDTRTVCRDAYEKSTQAFVSRLDPQLRFLRDYAHIRPFADHCRERIVRVNVEDRMRLAIEEARQSRREGNKGYGAVAVLGERLLAQGHDTAVVETDPSLHAEMNVLRQAARMLGTGNLSGVVLLSTCEPCPMCAAMAVWSNVSAIVFGASAAETAARGKLRILVSAQEIVSKSPVIIEVISGILHEECLALYV